MAFPKGAERCKAVEDGKRCGRVIRQGAACCQKMHGAVWGSTSDLSRDLPIGYVMPKTHQEEGGEAGGA